MKYVWISFCICFVLALSPYAVTSTQFTDNDTSGSTSIDDTDNVPHGRFGKLTAQPGKAGELLDIMLKAADAVSQAEGCMKYIIGRDEENENIIWIYEMWTSKTHHRNSLQLESVRELITQAIPLLDGQPEPGVSFEIMGGTGI